MNGKCRYKTREKQRKTQREGDRETGRVWRRLLHFVASTCRQVRQLIANNNHLIRLRFAACRRRRLHRHHRRLGRWTFCFEPF